MVVEPVEASRHQAAVADDGGLARRFSDAGCDNALDPHELSAQACRLCLKWARAAVVLRTL